jgi:hypothetical protein
VLDLGGVAFLLRKPLDRLAGAIHAVNQIESGDRGSLCTFLNFRSRITRVFVKPSLSTCLGGSISLRAKTTWGRRAYSKSYWGATAHTGAFAHCLHRVVWPKVPPTLR